MLVSTALGDLLLMYCNWSQTAKLSALFDIVIMLYEDVRKSSLGPKDLNLKDVIETLTGDNEN